jgi:glycosyltransferase involved in cell wall biosynthesis
MTEAPLRSAHLLGARGDGGAEAFFERLTAALNAGGDPVLPLIRTNAARAARLRAAGLAPVELGFGGPLDLLTRPRAARHLRAFRPDVVVAWMGRAARHAPRGPWVLAGRLGGYYDLRRFRHCRHLIGNTRAIVDWILAQGWPAERVHHLPNFAADLAGAAPIRPDFIPAGAPLILAAGRLHRNKAFDILIRAMPRLPGAHILIAGEGPERAALEALARTEGVADRLHMPGWRRDTAGLLAGADIFVCPSRHEPLGNVVIEAFSAARPTVASDIDGPAALIAQDQTGLKVPPDDPEALATALAALLADPARAARLAAAGRAVFEAEHAPAPVLARWRAGLVGMRA